MLKYIFGGGKMNEIKIPKSINEKLLDDEKVIGSWWHFYATNKRLFRYNRKSDYSILDYNKMTIDIRIMTSFIWGGISIIFIGLIIFFLANISSPYRRVLVPSWLYWLMLICSIMGGILFILSRKYYQIRSSDFSDKELKKWRIQKGRKTDRFIEIIKKQTGVNIEK